MFISIKILLLVFCLSVLTSYSNSNPVSSKHLGRTKRWAIVNKHRYWPNATVYYKFLCTEFTTDEKDGIKTALQEIMDKTCVRFIEIDETSDEENFIQITCLKGGSCRSKLGFTGGAQNMNLARVRTPNPLNACLSKRKIQHEFLHAIGFLHEHTSFNRDKYLDVLHENIKPDYRNGYFNKDTEAKTYSYGCAFDYNSVMMPPALKHSKNGKVTLWPKDNFYTPETIGIAEGISECDVIRINNMYCKNEDNSSADNENKVLHKEAKTKQQEIDENIATP